MLSAWVRQKTGRHKHPTAGSIDSQSDKTTALVGIVGFDTGKNFKAASAIFWSIPWI
jgi:putative transposase